MDPLVRRVVAGWNFRVAMSGWNPPIPDWVFSRFHSKSAFAPSGDKPILALAKESVNILLPNLLNLFRKTLGDRYSMNASSRIHEIYYFFSPPQPIDSIAMHLGVHGEMSTLTMSYIPFTIGGKPDFSKLVELKEIIADPEVVGMHMMNMGRKLMSKVRPSRQRTAGEPVVVRADSWDYDTDATLRKMTRSGHFYRGMTEVEWRDHKSKGYIQSNRSYSLKGEGTSFSDEAAVAEDYANFGRDDPRKTRKSNFLVEVKDDHEHFKRDSDGYYKAQDPVPFSLLTHVWEMYADDEHLVLAKLIR